MNRLFYGDNLSALRESIADEFCWSVDLIYLDPGLSNSSASYNVFFLRYHPVRGLSEDGRR
jgi:hypothetical protein